MATADFVDGMASQWAWEWARAAILALPTSRKRSETWGTRQNLLIPIGVAAHP
jgi:hypothetical protein